MKKNLDEIVISANCEIPRKKIVVIDDNSEIRYALQFYLSKKGFDVTVFEDASEAEKLIFDQNRLIDLIISDIQLPDADGVELANRIGEVRKTPIIFCSAGLEDYITLKKPFSLRDIDRIIEEYLKC